MTAIRVALAFVLFGSLWVLGSDELLSWAVPDPLQAASLQSFKGMAFVLLSGALIWLLVARAERAHARLEARTQAQAERLAQILDISPAVIYAVRLESAGGAEPAQRLEFVSQQVLHMTGYSVEHLMQTPDWWSAHVHPDDWPQVQRAQATLFEQGELQHRYRLRCADGHFCLVDDHVVLMKTEAGQACAIVGAWLDMTEGQQAELRIQESERRYRELFDLNPHPMWVYELATLRFTSVNSAALRRYGYSRAEFLDMTLDDIRAPEDVSRLREAVNRLRQQGNQFSSSGEWMHRAKDGSSFWVEISGHTFERDGQAMRLVLALDVTERRQARERDRLITHVFESSQQAIFITDAKACFLSINRAFTQITGYTLDEVRGRTPALLKSGRQDQRFYEAMWSQIRLEGHWEGEIWNRRRTGEIYPEWLTVSAINDDRGQVQQYLGLFTEISGHKAAEERIQRLVNYDPLTELPNRTLMADRARMAIVAAAHQRSHVVLMLINIDHFSAINESLGHDAGDRVLRELARRLAQAVPPDDTVSRQGADDFLLLLPHTSATDAVPLSQRLMAAVSEPLEVEGQVLRLTASIGVAQYPEDGTDLATLSQAVSSAVHQAKRAGRASVRFFSREVQEQTRETLAIAHDLRWAIERNQLVLHYQPQFDARSRRIVGLEALVRWQHPEWGLVPPSRFIPVAEEAGLIEALGHWVMQEAVRQTAAWQAEGLPVVPVAVNLSLAQFRRADLHSTVQQTLTRFGLSPQLLELELTESVAMEDSDYTITTIARLKQMGLQLSIDDFGTGYSSLGYLKRFAIDKLKIDQSFVRGLHQNRQDEAIVTAVIGLAGSLGLRTIAEGVETEAQLDFLLSHGCHEIQGWLLGRAMPADVLAERLRMEA